MHRRAGIQQAQVVAVARAKHQAIFTQRHRFGIFVTGTVDDFEPTHDGTITTKRAESCPATTVTPLPWGNVRTHVVALGAQPKSSSPRLPAGVTA